MAIPEEKIAEVADAADIVEVISGYVTLRRAGKDYRGLCPFHGDKDPSFYVSPQKRIFYCFGCQTGGSVFNFFSKIEGVSFAEAVKSLARRYGIQILESRVDKARQNERERILDLLDQAYRYFRTQLRTGPAAQAYLENRSVSAEWTEKLGIGFAPDSWSGLCEHLRKRGVDMHAAEAAGLVRPRQTGGYYDYFRERVMIPIHDLNEQVIAFGGRALGSAEPKYLNSPESLVFKKKRVLYGLSSAREAIRQQGEVVLVEGYFDQISLRVQGLENVVAPLGTSLGKEQVSLIRRFTPHVTLIFDGDEAGLRAVRRAIPLFVAQGMEPRCLILREYKDPDEAIQAMGRDEFMRHVGGAQDAIEFFLDYLEDQYDLRTLHGRNLALQESLPVLREIAESKERDYLIERFAYRLHVKENRLVRVLKDTRRNSADAGPPSSRHRGTSLFDYPADERNVVRGMLLRDGFIDRVRESGVIKDVQDPFLRRLAEEMLRFRTDRGTFEPESFCSSLQEEELAAAVAGWLRPSYEEDDLCPEVDGDQVMDECLEKLRLRKLERRKEEIQRRMRQPSLPEEEYLTLGQELIEIKRTLGP
jgi:DNA primase